jgi:glycine betaine/choline ABC-type transport system substrate-binding protein
MESKMNVEAQAHEAAEKLKLVWSETSEKVQTAFRGTSKDAKELANRIEESGKKAFDEVREQLHSDKVKDALNLEAVKTYALRVTRAAADGMHLVTVEELDKLAGKLEAMVRKLESKRPPVSKKAWDELVARVDALEKFHKGTPAKAAPKAKPKA